MYGHPINQVAALAPNVPALYELHFGVPMAGAILSALNVAALAPNVPAMYELHFGVPMAGAILSALNQLDPKIIFVDHTSIRLLLKATQLDPHFHENPKPLLVAIHELDPPTPSSNLNLPAGFLDYGTLLESGDSNFEIIWPDNECDPISVNFTSGSTGIPKAAVYSHRAAYLNSIGMIFLSEIVKPPVFLWTVDMFRCNGWCFPWAMAALGGTNICLRENYTSTPETILDLIVRHKVTLLCGKPMILNLLAGAANPEPLPCQVDVFVSGPLPPVHVIMRVKDMGFNVKVGYGMTEALGPAIMKPWSPENGFASPTLGLDIDVKEPITMRSVPSDGTTVGEVMLRGNTLMTGYLSNPQGTERAFNGGWYNTRDIGVRLPSGHIQLKDRAVDIITSGPNRFVSSLEVEEVLACHPEVVEAAVVGVSDEESGGQVPCAFLKVRNGSDVKEEHIIEFCTARLPSQMVPRIVWFGDLPMNSTGKIQKYVLRQRVNAMGSSQMNCNAKY
ncbi:hypothetical protein CRG98_023604 [Punica granatum]|uniref:Acyl-activating enzyme 1, peroxisomal n=1 Tax=Punica granatum TaxID=22663 RepID=A0A2I0JIC5_PUNGR|nr:hypothetical protein CRG98_023604 [Punica granatum]